MDAPAFSTVEISSARRVKSAERIDGAISIMAMNQGVGVRTGGRRLTLVLPVARLAGVVFELVCVGVAFEFALPFTARFVLRFARFALPFELSFAFRFAGLRLFAFAFELLVDDELLLSWFAGEALAFAFESAGVETSPSFAGRLISTATVCPTFTISPA